MEKMMNTYVAFYKGKTIEVMANTSFEARQKAVEMFKAKKPWDVSVVISKKGGEVVVHNPADVCG